jgi:hypothetical protein
MPSPALHRPSLLQAAWSAVLLLCLAAQPVVALAHELHEVQHESAPASGHAALEAGTPHADGALDALLHTMDCCAHGSMALASALHWTFLPARLVHPPALDTPAPRQAAARHLRPPISA